MTRILALCLGLLLVAAPWQPAEAQGQRAPASRPAPKEPARPEPPPEPPPAPYEQDLLALAEVVGSLAFLRKLCAEPDAAEWPARMQALLQAEGVTEGRRERLAGAYNKGFRDFALTYRQCTPNAGEASLRFLRRGELLSRAIAARYGG